MMLRFVLGLLGGTLLIGATSPPTETDLGSRIARPKRAEIPDRNYSQEEKGRIALFQYARCTFARNPENVSAALERSLGNDGSALNALASDGCLAFGEMTFSSNLFRGALFGEMYRRHESSKSRPWLYPIKQLDFSVTPIPGASPEFLSNYFMLGVADSVYLSDPEAVRAIVVSEPTSPAQIAAYDRVIPLLGGCVPKDVKLAFSRAAIEAAFGEYLYRSLVPKIPVSAGKPN